MLPCRGSGKHFNREGSGDSTCDGTSSEARPSGAYGWGLLLGTDYLVWARVLSLGGAIGVLGLVEGIWWLLMVVGSCRIHVPEKVYDRVPREELWYCMRKSGVAEKYIRIVQDMYEGNRTVAVPSYRGNMDMTEDFGVTASSSVTLDPGFDATTDNFSYDYDNELCDTTSIEHFGAIFTPMLFSLVVIFSLFGNVLVIVILTKYENLRSLTNAFIMNMAVSDLFFTSGLPFWIHDHMYGWTLGEPACKIVTFIFNVGFYSSGILLILMAVQRYVAVMNPLSDIVSTKGLYSVLVSLIIWAVSVLVSCPALIFTKVLEQNYCVYVNSYWGLWGIYQQNILFMITSVVFLFCYSQITCRLLQPMSQRRKSRTLKLIFTLMFVFFLGWGPYNIMIFLQSLYFWPQPYADSDALAKSCDISKKLDYAMYIGRLLAFSHCCLNPVFYVFLGVKFKNHLKRMLKSWGHNYNSIRSRQGRHTLTSITSARFIRLEPIPACLRA
ncbi:chemokine XC receptor 1-like [Antennarius striatus]|uniref:chemokine XC receptor 1-like n=1 Tax=Antennarius striatus TaxID=241820 RepID=UPI0035AF51AB